MRSTMLKSSGVAFCVVALLVPVFVSAATVAELQAKLAALMSQISVLQGSQTTSTLSISCPNLSRNLSRGMKGSDVTQLQQFLISQNLLASDSATGFFGAQTEVAVKQWQTQQGIASSGTPSTTGYGAVGPKTRAAIVVVCGATATVVPSPSGLPPTTSSPQISADGGGGGLNSPTSISLTTSVAPPTTGQTANVPVAATTGDSWVINFILATGQSLSVGADGCPALTTDPSTLNLTVTNANNILQNGFAALVENKLGVCRSAADPEGAIATPVETPYSAMTRFLSSYGTDTTNRQYAVGMHGGSGLPYSGIKKGTASYATGIAQLQKAKTLADAIRRPLRVAGTTVVHGETDHLNGTSALAYEYAMQEWQRDYEADARAIAGQSGIIPLFESQMSSFTAYGQATSLIPEAQLKAAENNPGAIVLVGPKYMLDYRKDGGAVSAHLSSIGYRQLGEYYGKALKRILIEKSSWVPLSPRRIDITGRVITLKLHVPWSPISIDTTLVKEAANYGFEFADGSANPPVIEKVEITGADTISITLTHAPTGNTPRLRYAHTGTPGSIPGRDQSGSARGNIRDNDTTASLYGNSLYNWLVHFDKPVPYFGLHMTTNTCKNGTPYIGWAWETPPSGISYYFTREEGDESLGMPLNAALGHFEASLAREKYTYGVAIAATNSETGTHYGKETLDFITLGCP